MTRQFITRKGSFDAAHRIMNERFKCFNIHGHTYLYSLTFLIEQTEPIGYLIDFKEIKRIALQWIEDWLDHGCILNPQDIELIKTARTLESKMWLMSLNGDGNYCNPSVENIAKELFLAIRMLYQDWRFLKVHQVRLYETPQCYTDCTAAAFTSKEIQCFSMTRSKELIEYARLKGKIEYDSHKIHLQSK